MKRHDGWVGWKTGEVRSGVVVLAGRGGSCWRDKKMRVVGGLRGVEEREWRKSGDGRVKGCWIQSKIVKQNRSRETSFKNGVLKIGFPTTLLYDFTFTILLVILESFQNRKCKIVWKSYANFLWDYGPQCQALFLNSRVGADFVQNFIAEFLSVIL